MGGVALEPLLAPDHTPNPPADALQVGGSGGEWGGGRRGTVAVRGPLSERRGELNRDSGRAIALIFRVSALRMR